MILIGTNASKINEEKLLFNTFPKFHELLRYIFITLNSKKFVSYASVIHIIEINCHVLFKLIEKLDLQVRLAPIVLHIYLRMFSRNPPPNLEMDFPYPSLSHGEGKANSLIVK